MVKNLPSNSGETRYKVSIPGLEDPLEEETASYFSIFAWRISWTEEPGRLQPMGSKSHNWRTEHAFIPWLLSVNENKWTIPISMVHLIHNVNLKSRLQNDRLTGTNLQGFSTRGLGCHTQDLFSCNRQTLSWQALGEQSSSHWTTRKFPRVLNMPNKRI